MFLSSNPGRGKSNAEKEEMRSHYKPGEDVIPPVEMQQDSDERVRMVERMSADDSFTHIGFGLRTR
jgi:hypothetical protein